jgi:hypothetical protein
MSKFFAAAVLFSMLLSVRSFAKRAPPVPVTPVVDKGITYSAPNDSGKAAYVVASDATGKELFRIKVFDTPIDPSLEEDVQWVFITRLKLSGGALLVEDEKNRCYAIDLATRSVKRKYFCRF